MTGGHWVVRITGDTIKRSSKDEYASLFYYFASEDPASTLELTGKGQKKVHIRKLLILIFYRDFLLST